MNLKRRFSKAFIISCLFAGIAGTTYAQQQKTALALAEEHFHRYEYKRAAVLYRKAVSGRKAGTDVFRRLADCYRHLDAYQQAADLYGFLIKQTSSIPDDLLYYADALKSLGRYDDARQVYKEFMLAGGADVSVKIAGCDSAAIWIKNAPVYFVRNMEELNTSFSEWGASWDPDGQLVFTSDSLRYTMLAAQHKSHYREFRRTGHAYQKLYRVDTVHRNPDATLVRGIDAVLNDYKFHIGPVVFSSGGDTAYLTITNPEKISYQRDKSRRAYGTRRLELYVSIRSNGEWQSPEPFIYSKPEAYSIGHAALADNGGRIYFSSDMPGSAGETDIWYCEKRADGSWGQPENCGPAVNTAEEEAFPAIHHDGRLYFSSKGHAGMGGFDIFYASGHAADWSVPVNMGAGFNSAADDFSLVARTADEGMFASNRSGGRGDDDLYAYTRIVTEKNLETQGKKAFILEAGVYATNSGKPASQALLTLKDWNTGHNWTLRTADNGKVYMVISKDHQYVLQAAKPGYSNAIPARFTAGLEDTLRLNLYLPEGLPVTGDSYVLQHIYYDYDDYRIRPEGFASLDSLAVIMKNNPAMHIALASHTDSRAGYEYNIALSQKRASVVKDYLVQRGASPGRIVAKGYGESRPVNHCTDNMECSEEEHQANRRTEVTVYQK